MVAAAVGVSGAAATVTVQAYREGKSLFTFINRKKDYAKNLKINYDKMTADLAKLCARRDDHSGEAKRDQGKQLKKECENWIEGLPQIEEKVRELESNYKKETRYPGPEWHRLWARAKLSKKMGAMSQNIQRTLESGKFETGVVVDKLPERVKRIYGPKIEANTSLHTVVEEILGYLKDIDVKIIGLWGTAGIGKTTILQNINNDENIEAMFDTVIWVTILKTWSNQEVQNAISRRLGLRLTLSSTMNEAAGNIAEELKNKRYLLLLDEVWRGLDLDAIGFRDNQNDSKIVLTTRERNICYNMGPDRVTNVKQLGIVDAWKLFSANMGPEVHLPLIKPLAELVVKECSGIPLLINGVAKAFQTKKGNVYLWKDGLDNLRIWPNPLNQGIDEVLKVLEFCYEDLKGEDKKDCFLYSALYPEDCEIYIDYLLECWNAEGFIPNVKHLKDARNKGHTILNNLIDVSLVEITYNQTHIKINKMLHNMALRISSNRENFNSIVRGGEGLKEPPNEKEWERANRISLLDNKLYSLPESPNCSSLSTLFLHRNPCLEVIPNNFFRTMKHLRVLNLHRTGIKSLPTTISQLIRLKALYLNSCHNLTIFPSIKKGLSDLEVLDIRGTGINNIPSVVGTFRQLRCLRMSLSNSALRNLNEGQLRIINHNVISKLSMLEELSIDGDPHNQYGNEVVMAITLEVAGLKHLVSLSFCFPEVDCLKTFTTASSFWKNFHSFTFQVGYHDFKRYQVLEFFGHQIYRRLKYANGEDVDQAISDVLAITDAFELINHKGASSLSAFGIQSMNTMRSCLVEGCDDIETIIDGREATEGSMLIFLEKLYIKNVRQLVRIWEGPVHKGSLARLTTLRLRGCASLKNIFSEGMIQQLSQLQQLRVEECPEIEELIILPENGGLHPDSLPKLNILVLLDLPKLTSISGGDYSLRWVSLEKIQIYSCDLLKKLPFQNDNATRLISIEGQQAWWSSLEWEDQFAEQRLHSICCLN